jgi:hypothetical protein
VNFLLTGPSDRYPPNTLDIRLFAERDPAAVKSSATKRRGDLELDQHRDERDRDQRQERIDGSDESSTRVTRRDPHVRDGLSDRAFLG